ncbi:MAG: MerR family transcriptional regulator [Acidimicrobiales bacterium]
MNPVPESESLSIGEILDLLKADFPDVTISKIRFLESQGLLDPERTASGYRKFYPADVDRLRWILRQQRENFLPLKVIKGRLEAEGDDAVRTASPAEPAQGSGNGDPRPGRASPGPAPPPASPVVPPSQAAAPAEEPQPPSPAAPTASAPSASAPSASAPTNSPADTSPAGGRPDETPPDETPPTPAGGPEGGTGLDLTSATFTRDELAKASGLSPADLAQLERHGLLVGSAVGRQLQYDGEALVVARLAAAFASHGVEPRHLRMYKNSAEREAGFYEQVVLPYMKQRNPGARRQALDTLNELCRLGEGLRNALLRRALRDFGSQPEVRRRG